MFMLVLDDRLTDNKTIYTKAVYMEDTKAGRAALDQSTESNQRKMVFSTRRMA